MTIIELINQKTRPLVMGILNVTPDSFSDGGRFLSRDVAIDAAAKMIESGADIIDIGGESTRPGAAPVTVDEELNRTIPVVEAIAERFETPISIDTSTARVMHEAVNVGAAMINDVRALQREEAIETASNAQVPICLMHMQGTPQTMQQNPTYSDVVADIVSFLKQRIDACKDLGIPKSSLMIDPGFGFGKTLDHNYQLLANLKLLRELDCPILVGASRKSMLGNLLNRETDERLAGSLAFALLAAQNGADIIRVHDVAETVDVLKVFEKTLASVVV